MHRYLISVLIFIAMIFLAFLMKNNVVTTIKFFPIDDVVTIENAETMITMENNNDITWVVSSTSSEDAYLRQDISLLYENGLFKGVFSSWRQDIALLNQQLTFPPTNSARLEAISFHHAEIHHLDDTITSAQDMTNNQLYIVNEDSIYRSFHEPSNELEIRWQETLNEITNQQLSNYWKHLMSEFNLDPEAYDLIPLTELHQYETENFPNRTREETDEILGKLWEGLYKNYVVLLNEEENRESEHYIPLILFAKNQNYLYIIYELNGEKQKLIQQIS